MNMKISTSIFLIVLSFMILVIIGCGNVEKNRNDQPEEMAFQINKALLGEKYSDSELGFSFSPPSGCEQMPKNMVQQVKGEIQKSLVSPDSLVLQPKQFFMNEEEGFFCLLTALPSLVLSDSSIRLFQQVIENSAEQGEVQHSNYKYNEFVIFQSLIISKEIINFKIMIPQAEHKSFQIDYIVPKSIYANKIEVIESSIGSLSKQP